MPTSNHNDHSPTIPGRVHKSSRRNRVPLSCEPCRTRKLRCNREKPCQNCTVRDQQANCKYGRLQDGGAVPQAQISTAKQTSTMQQRIDRLENLVKSLITQHHDVSNVDHDTDSGTLSKEDLGSDSSGSTHSPGNDVVKDEMKSVYKDVDEWYDVLQEINKLKEVWNESQEEQTLVPTFSNNVDGSSLLFGHVQRIDKMELLRRVPPKHQVDKLISYFFDREKYPIPIVPIIHEPTFMREYAEHWKDPSKTSVIWLGLLFSILSINMLAYQQFGETPDYEGKSENLFQLYRMRTAQCLIIGDIAKCLPYTIETLRLNATAELNRKDDNSRGLWIMTGVLVRAAINMGYHRDPSQTPSISPLQAEYRRRVWASVMEMDDMASFVVGFPRMISTTFADTREPSNLFDWELSAEMDTLPQSRPMSEVTDVTYLIYKTRLFRALGRITDFNNTPTPGSYEQILDIDNNLKRAYQDLPTNLRIQRENWLYMVNGQRATSSHMQLEVLYHQGMCQLHRRFVAKGREDPRFKYSRDQCISSALEILKFQQVMEPFWYKFSRIKKGLILSSMILFLELECRRRISTHTASVDVSVATTDRILKALETACSSWEKAQSHCEDAQKIHRIVSNMLLGLQKFPASGSSLPNLKSPTELPGVMAPSVWPFDADSIGEEGWTSTFNNDMDIDWTSWDAFIEGAIFDSEPQVSFQ